MPPLFDLLSGWPRLCTNWDVKDHAQSIASTKQHANLQKLKKHQHSPKKGCINIPLRKYKEQQKLRTRRFKGICRADLSVDAPFAIAIGACMLNSLVFTDAGGSAEEEEDDAVVGPTDARFTVMSIISFIPYFNWLSWVFAWMDTSKRRYAVYAVVYLAPYLRSNLSLSPDESWLPIASIVLCIIHIQIEASIQSGDLDSLSFFSEAVRRFSPAARAKDRRVHQEGREQDHDHLPSAQERLWDEIRKFGMPQKPLRDHTESETADVEADKEKEP